MPSPFTATVSVSSVVLAGPVRVKVRVPVGDSPPEMDAESVSVGVGVVPKVIGAVGLAVLRIAGVRLAIVTLSAAPPWSTAESFFVSPE